MTRPPGLGGQATLVGGPTPRRPAALPAAFCSSGDSAGRLPRPPGDGRAGRHAHAILAPGTPAMDDPATGRRDVFGAQLREHRLAVGLTQEALAERAGLGVRTIQALEGGRAGREARRCAAWRGRWTCLRSSAPGSPYRRRGRARVARRAAVAAGLEARVLPVALPAGTGMTGMVGAADGASLLAAPPPSPGPERLAGGAVVPPRRPIPCPSCGHANRSAAAFCEACGARLATDCPRCSSEVPPGGRFCGACGARLVDVGAPPRRRAARPARPRRRPVSSAAGPPCCSPTCPASTRRHSGGTQKT